MFPLCPWYIGVHDRMLGWTVDTVSGTDRIFPLRPNGHEQPVLRVKCNGIPKVLLHVCRQCWTCVLLYCQICVPSLNSSNYLPPQRRNEVWWGGRGIQWLGQGCCWCSRGSSLLYSGLQTLPGLYAALHVIRLRQHIHLCSY